MRKEEETDKLIKNPLLKQALKGNPFLLPDEYFINLTNELLMKTRISEMGDSSFKIPAEYQDDLRLSILSKVTEQKIKTAVKSSKPKLSSDYIEDLQQRILNKTVHLDETVKEANHFKTSNDDKSFNKVRRIGQQKWITFVAAASLLLVMGIFAILEGKKNTTKLNSKTTIVQVESLQTDDIINYLAYYSEVGDLEYLSDQLEDSLNSTEGISTQEIKSYLEYSL